MNTSQNNSVNKAGFIAGVGAFCFTIAYVLVQILQVLKMIAFPWDEVLIYGTSLGIVIPFTLEMLALHYITPPDKKFWSHAALIFTMMYAVFVTANYIVQLATVLPNKLKGTYELVKILDQTPHSLFWDFDAVGYIFMGIAMLAALQVFCKTGFEKWVRFAFLANGLVTPLIAVVYFYPDFSDRLLILGFPWGITAPSAMLMLAIFFKKSENKVKDSYH
jgi:hypothetical protein